MENEDTPYLFLAFRNVVTFAVLLSGKTESMAYSRNELKNPDVVSDKDGLEYQWGRS